jgi:DNA modification methylase
MTTTRRIGRSTHGKASPAGAVAAQGGERAQKRGVLGATGPVERHTAKSGASGVDARRRTLAEFHPARVNANKHTQRGLGMLDAALSEDGYVAPMTAAADGEVIDGSARLERVVERFKGVEPIVVEHDGRRPIVMVRTDIPSADTELATRISLRANRIAQADLAWSPEALAELIAAYPNVTKGLWTKEELAELAALMAKAGGDGDAEPQIDQAAELQAQWKTERGQIWALDEHRLGCGDSTCAADVARLLAGAAPLLMVTDPPYGVEYDADWRNHALRAGGGTIGGRAIGKVVNDDRADWEAAWQLFSGDVAYVWHAGLRAAEVQSSLERSGFILRAQIVWAKSNLVISRGHYHGKHEPCFYAVRKGKTGRWAGDHSQTTLWEIDKPLSSETGHSTQKPLECMARPMRNHDVAEVYDPFCGSGTTIIAAEQLGRRCYAMELDAGYCAVILDRYARATGKQPVLLDQASDTAAGSTHAMPTRCNDARR